MNHMIKTHLNLCRNLIQTIGPVTPAAFVAMVTERCGSEAEIKALSCSENFLFGSDSVSGSSLIPTGFLQSPSLGQNFELQVLDSVAPGPELNSPVPSAVSPPPESDPTASAPAPPPAGRTAGQLDRNHRTPVGPVLQTYLCVQPRDELLLFGSAETVRIRLHT